MTVRDGASARTNGSLRKASLPAAVGVLPGLLLTAAIAAVALALPPLFGMLTLSPLLLAILLGWALRVVLRGVPLICRPGVAFAQKRLLRFAIVLLGLQISLSDIAALEIKGLVVVVVALILTVCTVLWAAPRLGVDGRLAAMIAAGTSICGVSAVIAASSVVRGRDDEVAYAVGTVTLFGTCAMFLYPALLPFLSLTPQEYGLWTGASVHEIAQVVAAAFQGGQASGEFGTIVKLSRVVLLAPTVVALGLWIRRGEHTSASVPFPWFVVGFVVLATVTTVDVLPAEATQPLIASTPFLLSMALAALGVTMDVGSIRRTGSRPLALAGIASLVISLVSLALIFALRGGLR